MRVTIAAVGRARADVFRDLYEHYAGRLRWPVVLREVEAGRTRDGAGRRQDEAKKLLSAIPRKACVVALEESGQSLSSQQFADWIGRMRDGGTGDLAFVIGGAGGLDRQVLDRADLALSLGPVTWPHLLVRGLLAEQLYRAQQILAGHPYHRADWPVRRDRV